MAAATPLPRGIYGEPIVRELTLEETKIILSDLLSSGDHEAGRVLERLLATHPNPVC